METSPLKADRQTLPALDGVPRNAYRGAKSIGGDQERTVGSGSLGKEVRPRGLEGRCIGFLPLRLL